MNVLTRIHLQPTREQEDLKGPVRRVIKKLSRTMDQLNYRKVDHNYFRHIQTFDSNGNLKEEVHYNPDGTESLRERYTYGENAQVTEKILCDTAGDPRAKWLFRFEQCEEEGLTCVVEEMRDEDGEFQGKELFFIDENGRKVKEFSYDASNEWVLESRFVYETVDGQLKMTWTTWNPQGEMMKKREYIYSLEGSIVEKRQLSESGELESKETFQYDENGLLLEEKFYQGETELYKYYYLYQFDNQNNWVERKTGIE